MQAESDVHRQEMPLRVQVLLCLMQAGQETEVRMPSPVGPGNTCPTCGTPMRSAGKSGGKRILRCTNPYHRLNVILRITAGQRQRRRRERRKRLFAGIGPPGRWSDADNVVALGSTPRVPTNRAISLGARSTLIRCVEQSSIL